MQIPNLRETRELHGLTQRELADVSGVSLRSIAGYEGGAHVRPNTARKLALALNVEVADLAGAPSSPKAQAPPSPEQPSFNGLLEEERRTAIYQHAWHDYITEEANRIDAEADSKGYAPEWMLEIERKPRTITRTLFDNGVLGNPESYPTEAEYQGSWEIADALTELEHAVERAWHAQERESKRLDRKREAAAELDSIWKRSKEADRSSKEALEAIRQERSESA